MVKYVYSLLTILAIIITYDLWVISVRIDENTQELKKMNVTLIEIKDHGIRPWLPFNGKFYGPDENNDWFDVKGQKYDDHGIPYGK